MNERRKTRVSSLLLAFLLCWPGTADAALDKLSSRLAGILDESYRTEGQTVESIKDTMDFLGHIRRGTAPEPDAFYIYVIAEPTAPDGALAHLTSMMEIVDITPDGKFLAGYIAEPNLALLTEEANVDFIRCVYPPRYRQQGLSDTQGNVIHNANLARTSKGMDGASVRIGVVSDGVTNHPAMVGTGDLPPVVSVPGGFGAGDEGTAMLEIIHDMSPGSMLHFYPSGSNIIAFGNAITYLVNVAQCQIVCDDVGWYSEPYFFHGYLAQLVQTLGAGTNYLHVSAAGNDAQIHHQQVFTDTTPANGEHDPLLQFTVPSNGIVEVWLQWDDNSPNIGNYDLHLEDSTGTKIVSSKVDQGGYPGEYVIHWNQSGSSQTLDAIIEYKTGNASRTMEVFVELWNGASISTPGNFSAVDSIFGHPAVPGVIAVGAVPHPTTGTIEPFSSQGPVSHLGGAVIQKPDVVAVDQVNVEVGNIVATYKPFGGTSAAAPHVAAILALGLDYSPGITLAGLSTSLTSTATDLGTPGYDNIFGNGLPDADATAGALNLPPALVTPSGTLNAAQKVPEYITGINLSDPDAGLNNVTLTLSAANAAIRLDDAIPGGVIPAEISNNHTPSVTVTSSLSAINTTLAANSGLLYLGQGGITGIQSMSLILSDNGNSGFGGPLTTSGTILLQLHNHAYEAWSRDQFGSDIDDPGKQGTVWGYDANPDSDRYTNEWEFFIGINPKIVDATSWFQPSISGSNFIYKFPVSHEIDPNAYTFYYTDDLADTWTSGWTGVPPENCSCNPHASIPDCDEVTITRPLGTREFLRIWFAPGYTVP